MKFILPALFLALSISTVKGQNPEITGMWSNSSKKKTRVYTITDKEMICNVSEANNRYASAVKNYKVISIIPANVNSGRIVAQLDSENVTKYYAFDYFNLNMDSVKVVETKTAFENADAAKACPATKADKADVFYTTEYMSRLSRIKSTPELTKEAYVALIKDAMKELQKPEYKGMKPETGVSPDEQVKKFMTKMLSKKQYQGKIIPETLEIGMVKYKDDAAVKKLYPYLKNSFVPKTAPGSPAPATPSSTTATKKS